MDVKADSLKREILMEENLEIPSTQTIINKNNQHLK
jgi:hypothetical protein